MANGDKKDPVSREHPPYMQNRELSWLEFDRRVLDQGADPSVPPLERLNFVSIFWSNLREFFMVRVGSLTDLSLVKKHIVDAKSGMTPSEQLDAVYGRCHELYPVYEETYAGVRAALAERGIRRLEVADLDDEQRVFVRSYVRRQVLPFLSPQVINARHPFPHLENGALYIVVRLDGTRDDSAVDDALLGLVPLPRQCERVIEVPSADGVLNFILLEHAIEMYAAKIFSMYEVKRTNVICVTRNADLDASEGLDEQDDDYREHMKRILKKRKRLQPVRIESARPLSKTTRHVLFKRLGLHREMAYALSVPLDMSYAGDIARRLPRELRAELTYPPFSPQWPAGVARRRIMDQVADHDVLLSYPYESMDPFVQLVREAAEDPSVVSIRITLYRMASHSKLADALIAAAEAGKEVTALFELRARFDESNNIEWSQRFEEAGCNVIYGFQDYKVHSKICAIIRQTDEGLQYVTQLGTGNYNEKTARLYTDFSYVTSDPAFGLDAAAFFHNMGLESVSDEYETLWVAPLQIKRNILAGIDEQIALARAGEPCGLFFKTNSVTDKGIMEKIEEASRAGVPVTMLVRGISCLVPGVAGHTENVRVVSIVGRLLEHSRIYGFGPLDDMRVYLSSADLMTRNMEKRIEIAWPVTDDVLRRRVLDYVACCLADTSKLRELRPDGSYAPCAAVADGAEPFDAQERLIALARERAQAAPAPTPRPARPRVPEPAAEPEPEPEPVAEPEPEEVLEPELELGPAASSEAGEGPAPVAIERVPPQPRPGLAGRLRSALGRLFGRR